MSNMNYFKLLQLKTFKIATPFKLLQPSDTPLYEKRESYFEYIKQNSTYHLDFGEKCSFLVSIEAKQEPASFQSHLGLCRSQLGAEKPSCSPG